MSLTGHLETLTGKLRGVVWPPVEPLSREWSTAFEDPSRGPIRLTGRLSGDADAGLLIVVVHGLGGSSTSAYVVRMAAAAVAAGHSCLRLNLRGSDRRGGDFYHAGLTADLHAAVASPELAGSGRLAIVGFSLGGHVVLRFATEVEEERVGAVAAISPPLDLSGCASAIDRPAMVLYRRYLLGHLKEIYQAIERREPGWLSTAEARRIPTIRQWDDRIVAPRFGFAGAADYYSRMSVGPILDRLRVRALAIAVENDPMVPIGTVAPFLDPSPDRLEVRRPARGGHVALPLDLGLGVDGGATPDSQIVAWAAREALR